MNLDIERLAREAGAGRGTSGRWLVTDAEIQSFAALVLEEAAKVCDDAKPSGGRMWTDEQAACFDCLVHVSEAIRSLKGEKA
jgi:hypothetical protein